MSHIQSDHVSETTQSASPTSRNASLSSDIGPIPILPSHIVENLSDSDTSLDDTESRQASAGSECNDASDTMAPPETLEEAECLLGVVYTQRNICEMKIKLADLQVEESRLRAQLCIIRAGKVKKHLHEADLKVGHVRNSLRESGYSQALQRPHKPRRIRRFNDAHFVKAPGGGLLAVKLD